MILHNTNEKNIFLANGINENNTIIFVCMYILNIVMMEKNNQRLTFARQVSHEASYKVSWKQRQMKEIIS